MDGTLVDNFAAIHEAYTYACKQLGLDALDYEGLKNAVGGGLSVTLSKLVDAKYIQPILDIYYPYFEEHIFDGAFLLDGVKDLLEELKRRQIRMAVFTNKVGSHSRRICEHFGIDSYFDLNLGVGDTPYRKPQAEFTQELLNQLQLASNQCCLVGDSPYDIAAGKAQNVDVYAVASGTHEIDVLKEFDPIAAFPDMNALRDFWFT